MKILKQKRKKMWIVKQQYRGKESSGIFEEKVIKALQEDQPDYFAKYFIEL